MLGATSGIAEATCRIWAAQGAQLFLVARNAEKLAAVAADLKTRGASYVGTAVADLDDTDKHAELLAHAVNSLTGMDIAYLAHGILGDQPRAEQDFEHAAQILHTNFVAPVVAADVAGELLRAAPRGRAGGISSVAGDRGRKSNYLYGSSKAGLSAFLAGLRNRVDREGVTVLTIKPGPVKTAMTAGMKGSEKFADVNKVAADDRQRHRQARGQPLRAVPVAADHVRHPQHPRPHLQKAQPVAKGLWLAQVAM